MALRPLLDHFPLFVLLIVAAVIDLRRRRIPNWLSFGLMTLGLARAIAPGGPLSIGTAVAGLFVAAAIPLLLYALGALGGGDVKLFAGIGAWLGPQAALAVFALECVIGLVLVLIQALSQGRTIALFRNSAALVAGIAHQGVAACAGDSGGRSFSSIDRPLPYAVPVALAAFIVILTRHWTGL